MIDATNVQPTDARKLDHSASGVNITVFQSQLCSIYPRNYAKSGIAIAPIAISDRTSFANNLVAAITARSLRGLEREGFRRVHVLRSPEEVDAAEIVREPLWNNLKHEHGPFDIIGDIHGCFDELADLFGRLGYSIEVQSNGATSSSYSSEPT